MSEKFILLFMQLSHNSQPLYPTTYLMFVLECLICQLKTNLQNLIIPPILLTCSFSSISKLISNTTIHLPSCSNQKPRVIFLLNYKSTSYFAFEQFKVTARVFSRLNLNNYFLIKMNHNQKNTYYDFLFISFPLEQAQTIPSPNIILSLLPNFSITFQA